MSDITKIGIIICDRYHTCAGGKCFRALEKREGGFSVHKGKQVGVAAFTTCDGCPGGNVEYAPEEMKKNGVQVIHFATGLLVGYPPCPHIAYFKKFIESSYGIQVVVGTHPIPQKYYDMHMSLGTWDTPEWKELISLTLADEKTRLAYN